MIVPELSCAVLVSPWAQSFISYSQICRDNCCAAKIPHSISYWTDDATDCSCACHPSLNLLAIRCCSETSLERVGMGFHTLSSFMNLFCNLSTSSRSTIKRRLASWEHIANQEGTTYNWTPLLCSQAAD